MRKKILFLSCLVLLVGGCGSKQEEVTKPVTVEDLKSATETKFKDFNNGRIELGLGTDLTVASDADTEVKGSVDLNVEADEDTVKTTVTLDLGEELNAFLPMKEFVAYTDLKDDITYTLEEDGSWVKTVDIVTNIEESAEEFNSFDLTGLTASTTTEGYKVNKVYAGEELVELFDLDDYSEYLEKVSLDITAFFDKDKVLNEVVAKLDVDELAIEGIVTIDGTLDVTANIKDVGKCDVSIPDEVIENAVEGSDVSEGFMDGGILEDEEISEDEEDSEVSEDLSADED